MVFFSSLRCRHRKQQGHTYMLTHKTIYPDTFLFRIHTDLYTLVSVYAYIYIYIYICVCVCVCVCVCGCMGVCVR